MVSDGQDSTTDGSYPVTEKITDMTGLDASLPDYGESIKRQRANE